MTQLVHDKAWKQLGTSGSGNHFVEFGAFTVEPDAGRAKDSSEPPPRRREDFALVRSGFTAAAPVAPNAEDFAPILPRK